MANTLRIRRGSGVPAAASFVEGEPAWDSTNSKLYIKNAAGVMVDTTGESFTNIAVSGQSTVVADSKTDTLTLVAGAGVSITTDDTTDTITFSSTVSVGIDPVISGMIF